ncbi:MAG TPA: DUF58 domain-containing protein, partial [Pyrinomonadaceae bacterium]|nr:DUF58 domain-containing protein [Pyrinomonadaceae bacterium]
MSAKVSQRGEGGSRRASFLKRPTWRDLRNIIVGTVLVCAGLGTALLTSYLNRAGYPQLVTITSILSLVFVLLIVIFVLPPLMRSARAELDWLNFGISVTKGGLIYLVILLIVSFAAWNTGNNLVFLIFAILTAALFVGFTAARASLRELIISARFPDHIFAGEPAPVIVTVRNTKYLLPSLSILVEARAKNYDARKEKRRGRADQTQSSFLQKALAYFVYVPRRAAVEQRVEQVFPRRGHLLVSGFNLSTGFPFGFLRHRRRLRARDVDIVVYPKPEPIDDALHALPMNAGRVAANARGAGDDLLRLRDYQPQDEYRRLDWKATARTGGRLIVREYNAEDERRVHLALDTFKPDGVSDEEFRPRFERGVTLAASLAAHFTDENAELKLTLGEEVGEFGSGADFLYGCLRRLALVEPGGQSKSWEESLAPTREDHYLIILTAATPGSVPSHLWRK